MLSVPSETADVRGSVDLKEHPARGGSIHIEIPGKAMISVERDSCLCEADVVTTAISSGHRNHGAYRSRRRRAISMFRCEDRSIAQTLQDRSQQCRISTSRRAGGRLSPLRSIRGTGGGFPSRTADFDSQGCSTLGIARIASPNLQRERHFDTANSSQASRSLVALIPGAQNLESGRCRLFR